jgi:hypothetical protein
LVSFLHASGNKVAYTDASCAQQELINGHYVITGRKILYSMDWDDDLVLIRNFVPVLCFLHERTCAIQIGGFDESLSTHEDWDYWIRLSRLFRPVHLKKVTCEFRVRTNGLSMSSSQQADFLRTIRVVYRKHRRETAGKKHIRRQQKQFLLDSEMALYGVGKRLARWRMFKRNIADSISALLPRKRKARALC